MYKDKLEVLKKKFLNSVGVGVKEVVYCFVKLCIKVLRDIIFIYILLIDDCVIFVKKDVEFKKYWMRYYCKMIFNMFKVICKLLFNLLVLYFFIN